jgi:hypothetical protein
MEATLNVDSITIRENFTALLLSREENFYFSSSKWHPSYKLESIFKADLNLKVYISLKIILPLVVFRGLIIVFAL